MREIPALSIAPTKTLMRSGDRRMGEGASAPWLHQGRSPSALKMWARLSHFIEGSHPVVDQHFEHAGIEGRNAVALGDLAPLAEAVVDEDGAGGIDMVGLGIRLANPADLVEQRFDAVGFQDRHGIDEGF